MVISTVNQVVYKGDGITTAWPFTFRIIDATDIHLTLVDEDDTSTEITSDFYVDVVNSTVYYPGYAPGAEPPEADQPPKVQTGQRLIVYREIPITQEKYLGDKWPFYVIELGLDKLTMILQQLRDWYGRCFHVPMGQYEFDTEVPVEAGKLLRVNKDGTGLEAVSDAPDSAAAAEASAEKAAKSAKDAADIAASVTWVKNFKIVNGKLCQIVDDE